MIGQLVDARSPISVATIILLLISVLLGAWAVAEGNPHPLLAAVLPLSIAVALWLSQPRHALVMIENDGLSHLGSSSKVPYERIAAITVGGALRTPDAKSLPALPLEIHYDDSCLVLPPKMSISAVELHEFLWSKVRPRPARAVHPLLSDYLAEQQEKFGQEKIQVIHTRELFPVAWLRRRNRWVCAALLITGMIWIGAAMAIGPWVDDSDAYGAWIALGCFTLLAAFVAYFALRSDRGAADDSQVAKYPNACVVVGPTGLAMVQGDIQGAIRWNEIMKVKSRPSPWISTAQTRGLQIRVRGGEIVVLDIYERSPADLEQIVRANLDQAG